MSTQFNDGFSSGDLVSPQHIQQFIPAIQGLEEGQAFFRPDVGVADAFKVDFSASGAGNKNAFSAYVEGQIVVFKAASANTGAATLEIEGPAGDLGPKPIVKAGSAALEAGDIVAGQMVAVFFNSTSGGRFEMVASPSAQEIVSLEMGGTGADLSAEGPGFVYLDGSSSEAEVRALSADDIASGSVSLEHGGTGADLSAEGPGFVYLDGSSSEAEVRSLNAGDIADGVLPLERGGTGTNLSGAWKGDMLVSDGSQIAWLWPGSDGQVLTADSSSGLGLSWTNAGGGGGGASDFLYGDGSDGNATLTSDEDLYEHKFYQDLTIESGVTLRPRGFKIYVRGTLTLDGTIDCNGNHALDSVGSTAGWPGWSNNSNNTFAEDLSGASGQLGTGDNNHDPERAAAFARGGDGGEGSVGPGGSGSHNVTFCPERTYRSLPAILSGVVDVGNVFRPGRWVCPGTGGGGGTGDGSSAAGGSGGACGGYLWVAARHIQGSGTLTANGGNGGAAGGPDAGGGGGGGGGMIYLLTSDSGNPYTMSVVGGTGGLGGGGVGTDGGNGENGLVVFRENM